MPILRVVATAILLTTAAACVRVQPWQRGALAQRCMRLDADAGERKLDGHVQEYREGSIGGSGAGGGGCGCN